VSTTDLQRAVQLCADALRDVEDRIFEGDAEGASEAALMLTEVASELLLWVESEGSWA